MGLTRDSALSELGIITGMTLPLISIPSTIIGALCMILIPRINASKKDLNLQLNYYIKFTIACVFIFIPTFIALGIPICEFIFNNYSAGLYLQQCCIIALPIGLAQITTSILNALNEEKKSFLYYIISNGFMLISILFLTKLFYIKAMPYTLGISSFILFTLNLRKIKKITGYKSSIFKECFYHVLLCLPILVLTKILFSTLTMFLNLFLSLIICSFVSVIFYLIFMVVFRVVDPKIIKNYIFKDKQKLKIKNESV
jgi:O-antigen/teichoic acid export membrane protein